MKAGDFADAVRAARLKRRRLLLRDFRRVAEHLARAREIEPATGPHFSQRREHVVRAIDVHVHRREAVGKTLRDETLRREVVTLVELVLAEHVKNAGVTL